MESKHRDVLIRPVITEKTTRMEERHNKFTFRVQFEASKPKIKQAVEDLFDVDVAKVNTMIMPGKPKRVGRFFGRRKAWKKAIVTLKEGEVLDFYAMGSAGEDVGVV